MYPGTLCLIRFGRRPVDRLIISGAEANKRDAIKAAALPCPHWLRLDTLAGIPWEASWPGREATQQLNRSDARRHRL